MFSRSFKEAAHRHCCTAGLFWLHSRSHFSNSSHKKIIKIRQFFLIFFDSLLNTCTLYALNFFTIHNFLQNKFLNNFDLVVYCKHSRGGVLISCVSPLRFRSVYSFFLCQVFSSAVYLIHLHNYCLHVFCFLILVPVFCNFSSFFVFTVQQFALPSCSFFLCIFTSQTQSVCILSRCAGLFGQASSCNNTCDRARVHEANRPAGNWLTDWLLTPTGHSLRPSLRQGQRDARGF